MLAVNTRMIVTGVFGVFLSACALDDTLISMQESCSDPRPQMCTMDYRPVCAVLATGRSKTYSNGCGACSDTSVQGYNPGACLEE